jgi:endonuclease-3
MAAPSRTTLISRTIKVLKKYYKPGPAPKERSLLEHLLFACLLENSPPELAEQVFATLQKEYYDWNEVRVSTVSELAEVTKPLVDPVDSATRLKQTLHSVFEAVYQFDLETLKKQNIGQAVKQLHKYFGTTKFVVSYVTQMALGGHSIPVNKGLLTSMRVVGVITDGEAKKGVVPGLERAVPKRKGVEYGSLLHQLGVEVGRSPYGPTARKLLLEIAPDCKDRLPKRQTKRPPVEEPPPSKPAKKAAAAKATTKKPAKPADKTAAKLPAKTKKKKPAKRPTKTRKSAGVKKKKTTGRRLTKKKPR